MDQIEVKTESVDIVDVEIKIEESESFEEDSGDEKFNDLDVKHEVDTTAPSERLADGDQEEWLPTVKDVFASNRVVLRSGSQEGQSPSINSHNQLPVHKDSQNGATNNHKARYKRSTAKQISGLAKYMCQNTELARGKLASWPTGRGVLESKWEELTKMLNKLGPAKTVTQWKVVWKDVKGRARKKQAALRKGHNQTFVPVYFTAEELEVLSVIEAESSWDIGGEELGEVESIETKSPAASVTAVVEETSPGCIDNAARLNNDEVEEKCASVAAPVDKEEIQDKSSITSTSSRPKRTKEKPSSSSKIPRFEDSMKVYLTAAGQQSDALKDIGYAMWAMATEAEKSRKLMAESINIQREMSQSIIQLANTLNDALQKWICEQDFKKK